MKEQPQICAYMSVISARLGGEQDVVHNDDEMEITLTMTLDPDLHLRFFDAATYVTWKRGLELLLTLLFAPGELSESTAMFE